ncbi:MAG: TatD family hydrolase [Dehalococcoidia bacterium]|nr:MAG: TatD family hydrolase [Dehalococcoidia bacterium]
MKGEAYRLIDSHVHLDEIENVEEAVQGAKQVGIVVLLAVGQDYDSNLKVLELSEKYKSFVYPALGLHPWNLGGMSESEIDRILRLVEDNIESIVAIGEVGLYYDKRVRARADKDRQKAVFKEILDLASRYKKPVSVHSRYSWKDSFDLVRESMVERAVFHWFTGLSSVLREIVAGGYFISATPAAEYHDEHRRAIKETPLENLLLETDAPVWYGRETKYKSRPADILRSLKAVAQVRGQEEAVVAEKTTTNAISIFGITI